MELVVQKFGGATLADLGKIKLVANRIHELKQTQKNIVIIVSAMSVTVFIKPVYRIQAIETLHQMIRVPKFF